MKITIKSLFTAFISLVMPGVGQLFYGEIGWALFWFVSAIITGGLTLWPSAIHCLFLANK